jgi:hypothetical protein
LVAAIWVIDKLENINDELLDNWIPFTMETNKSANMFKLNTTKRLINNFVGDYRIQDEVTKIKKKLNQYKLKIYNDWYNKYKKDNNTEPTETKQYNRIQYYLDMQYKYEMDFDKIYESKMKDFFDSSTIKFQKLKINEKKTLNIKTGDDWHEDFKKLEFRKLLDLLIQKKDTMTKKIESFINDKNKSINNTPQTGGKKNTRKNKRGGGIISNAINSAANVAKKAANVTKKTYYKIGKQTGKRNPFYKLLNRIFYTTVSNMNKRLMKKLFIMRDNSTNDKQTGYSVQDSLILFISKTIIVVEISSGGYKAEDVSNTVSILRSYDSKYS